MMQVNHDFHLNLHPEWISSEDGFLSLKYRFVFCGGLGWWIFFVQKRFLTRNYLDRHRTFVALHKLPEDHDESDQNGFSRKEKTNKKNRLVLQVYVYP